MIKQKIKSIIREKFPFFADRITEYKAKKIYKNQVKLVQDSPEKLVKYVFDSTVPEKFNHGLDLENPKTFHEKLNWLKLNWYNQDATTCSDKYLVRKFVEDKGLGHMLNELYAVYDSPDEIDFDALPDKFVMKTTHDSAHVILCTDKKKLNEKLIRKQLKWWMDIDYCYMSGEWVYHTEKPRIVCERFLEDKDLGELVDYKFFCFNGKPDVCFFASDRKNHVKADFYSLDWKRLPFKWMYETSNKDFPKPECLEEMIEASKILAEGFPFVRVDFYQANGKVYFGEMTFFHGGGMGWFEPENYDIEFGNKIHLPTEKAEPWRHILKR